MAPSKWLTCLVAATSFVLVHAAVFDRMSLRRQLDLNIVSQETPVSREYFYAGGRYVDDETGTGQHIFTNQMYVEKLSPAVVVESPKTYPLVFIHGQAQTSTVSLQFPPPMSRLSRLIDRRIG